MPAPDQPWLRILPCLDSDEMAECRRRELDLPRSKAAALGESAVEAARLGHYVSGINRTVDWRQLVQAAKQATFSLPPDAPLPQPSTAASNETLIQVTNETTLGAAQRLIRQGMKPLALNFANGIQPGGGFLTGARAQEETLCRSSALFQTLVGDRMYSEHRKRERADSTDWAILSPDVPVFRSDDGTELESPWLLSVISCAAPYAPDVGQPESGDLLQNRIRRVLQIANAWGYSSLILGAWGCGAFENDPCRTAKDFRSAIEHEFRQVFSHVVFAITDWSRERRYLGPFRDVFRPTAGG